MRTMTIAEDALEVPVIGIGCMRMEALGRSEASRFVAAAVERGLNFFDHADIYGGGRSEEIFREAARDAGIPRDRIVLQSKCGIRKGFWDFSEPHIVSSVDGILSRLGTEYLDFLLLHRPDALMEGEEVAAAFGKLRDSGKVRRFGVSNMNGGRIALLQSYLDEKLAVNQLQFSIANCGLIRSGMNVNMENDAGVERDGGVLDYCRLNGIAVQAWSPLQYGFFSGTFIDSPDHRELNETLGELAARYDATPAAVAIAWILRHPASMQPIVGTMNGERLLAIAEAERIRLSREEWYAVYVAAGNTLP